MPKITVTSPEVMKKLLETKNSQRIELTPEEKLERIYSSARSKGLIIKKFHFHLIENGKDLILYDGNKTKVGDFPKTIKGIKEARVFARKLFLKSPTIYRNGGFKFDTPFTDATGTLKDQYDEVLKVEYFQIDPDRERKIEMTRTIVHFLDSYPAKISGKTWQVDMSEAEKDIVVSDIKRKFGF